MKASEVYRNAAEIIADGTLWCKPDGCGGSCCAIDQAYDNGYGRVTHYRSLFKPQENERDCPSLWDWSDQDRVIALLLMSEITKDEEDA